MSEEIKGVPQEDALSTLFGQVLKMREFRDKVFSACLESYISEFTKVKRECPSLIGVG